MNDRLKPITKDSPGWNAWLQHHRGTKTETRMLNCLANCTPFYVPSDYPPEAPRADRLTRKVIAPAPAEFPDHGNADRVDEIAERLTRRQERVDADQETENRRRRSHARADGILKTALDAAAQNNYPDIGDRDDLDVIGVSDPAEEAELERIGRGPPMIRRKKTVPIRQRVVSLRDDAVGRMAKRGQLGDDAEERDRRLKAARYYEDIYARAEIGGATAIDFTRDVVDSSRYETPDTDARLAAQKRLGELDAALSTTGAELVRAILVVKWSIEQYAQSRGAMSVRDRLYWGRRFQECLDDIAKAAGLKSRPNRTVRHHDEYALAADNPVLRAALVAAKPGVVAEAHPFDKPVFSGAKLFEPLHLKASRN